MLSVLLWHPQNCLTKYWCYGLKCSIEWPTEQSVSSDTQHGTAHGRYGNFFDGQCYRTRTPCTNLNQHRRLICMEWIKYNARICIVTYACRSFANQWDTWYCAQTCTELKYSWCDFQIHLYRVLLYIHTLRVQYGHAAANLNSGYSKYAKVARVHYFCTIALRTSRAVLMRAWASRRVDLRELRVDLFSKRVITFCW